MYIARDVVFLCKCCTFLICGSILCFAYYCIINTTNQKKDIHSHAHTHTENRKNNCTRRLIDILAEANKKSNTSLASQLHQRDGKVYTDVYLTKKFEWFHIFLDDIHLTFFSNEDDVCCSLREEDENGKLDLLFSWRHEQV